MVGKGAYACFFVTAQRVTSLPTLSSKSWMVASVCVSSSVGFGGIVVAWANWEYLWNQPSVYTSLAPKQMHEEQRGNDIPETLSFLFGDGVGPIHCPLRTTFCLDIVCIATKRVCSRYSIANLPHVHDSFIVGIQKDRCFSHRTSFWICLQVLALRAR